MKKIKLSTFLLFLAFLAIGQKSSINTVSGTIVGFDGEGLAFAPISVVGKNKGALTDTIGHFNIAIESGDKLRFSYPGYQTVEYFPEEVTNELHGIIELNNTMLREVVIVGTKWDLVSCDPTICIFDYDTHLDIKTEADPFFYYPNPTIDFVNVSTTLSEGIINVFSSEGKLVMRQGVNDVRTVVNLNGLSAGLYVLTYENEYWAKSIGKVSLIHN